MNHCDAPVLLTSAGFFIVQPLSDFYHALFTSNVVQESHFRVLKNIVLTVGNFRMCINAVNVGLLGLLLVSVAGGRFMITVS